MDIKGYLTLTLFKEENSTQKLGSARIIAHGGEI